MSGYIICAVPENNLVIFCLRRVQYRKGTNMDLTGIIEIAAIIIALYLFLKLLSAPLKLAIKLLLHAASGFLLLLVEEIIGGFFDFSLGITFINCLIAGILGIPGVVLLVLAKLFL